MAPSLAAINNQLASGELAFEQAGAFLLGRDMAAQTSALNQSNLAAILDGLLSDQEELTRLIPIGVDEERWEKRSASIIQLFGSLKRGFLEGHRH